MDAGYVFACIGRICPVSPTWCFLRPRWSSSFMAAFGTCTIAGGSSGQRPGRNSGGRRSNRITNETGVRWRNYGPPGGESRSCGSARCEVPDDGLSTKCLICARASSKETRASQKLAGVGTPEAQGLGQNRWQPPHTSLGKPRARHGGRHGSARGWAIASGSIPARPRRTVHGPGCSATVVTASRTGSRAASAAPRCLRRPRDGRRQTPSPFCFRLTLKTFAAEYVERRSPR